MCLYNLSSWEAVAERFQGCRDGSVEKTPHWLEAGFWISKVHKSQVGKVAALTSSISKFSKRHCLEEQDSNKLTVIGHKKLIIAWYVGPYL